MGRLTTARRARIQYNPGRNSSRVPNVPIVEFPLWKHPADGKTEIMVIATPELQRAIDEAGDEPVPITDPETHRTYLVIKVEVYERLCTASEEEEIDPSFFEIDNFEPTRDDPR